jgi:hypothetical protein
MLLPINDLGERILEVEKRLRFLCTCDAESLSDYERINLFVRAGSDAAVLFQELRLSDSQNRKF